MSRRIILTEKTSRKELCEKCTALATWSLMSSPNGEFCDDCVPRGCSCMAEPADGDHNNGDRSNWIQPTDELGREYPCCEFDYDEEGTLKSEFYEH